MERGRSHEHSVNRVYYTSYIMFHDAQSQITTRNTAYNKGYAIKALEM